MTGSADSCRCDSLWFVRDEHDLVMFLDHLVARADVGSDQVDPGISVSEYRCPRTGFPWTIWSWAAGRELRRRPVTHRADYLDPDVVAARADAINEQTASAWQHRHDASAHRCAIERLWSAKAALYSPEWRCIVEELRRGEPSAVEPSLVFLETDVRCFRSGYEKEALCRFLPRGALDDVQRQRALEVARRLLADARRPERERRAFARLAVRL